MRWKDRSNKYDETMRTKKGKLSSLNTRKLLIWTSKMGRRMVSNAETKKRALNTKSMKTNGFECLKVTYHQTMKTN